MPLFLSANLHQGDERFSVRSRGKQCAFISLSAVLTAQNIPLFNWSRTTFNNVLLQGDKLYLQALNTGLIVLDSSVEFISVDNLPEFVSVFRCRSTFSYEIESPMVVAENNNNNLPIVVEPIEAQNKSQLPIVVEPIEAQNKSQLPIVVEPIEAQNKSQLPIVVEPIEAQNKTQLPIVVEPIEAQNKSQLPIVVEPIEVQNKTQLPIVVEPIEAQNKNQLPIVVEPIEARSIYELSIPGAIQAQSNDTNNENLILFINYKKELQGLVKPDREIECHYYDIHTALFNTFLNDSYAILVFNGYMMALIKQENFFYLFDPHARDVNGMPDPDGTAVVMKFADILKLEQFLFSLSRKLHINLFEIVPVCLTKSTVSVQTTKCGKDRIYQKKRCSEETEHDKQVRL